MSQPKPSAAFDLCQHHAGAIYLKAKTGLRNPHGFFTRQGGLSKHKGIGLASDLNCGLASGEAPEIVQANRDRVRAAMGAEKLVTVHQVHSARVLTLGKDALNTWDFGQEADGLVTNVPGLALGVLSADCCPLLFEDKQAGVIGAAHAGWRGAHAGIAQATVEAMVKLGAETRNISVVLGPCIQQASYEVDEKFRSQILSVHKKADHYFAPGQKQGHWQFDLPSFIEISLASLGLGQIQSLRIDTLSEPGYFFSHRRGFLRKKNEPERQISAIAIPVSC